MISRYIDYPLDLSYGVPRTPGTHLSGIIKVMARESGLDKGKEKYSQSISDLITLTPVDKVGGNGTLMRCAFGYAMEEWLGRQLVKLGIDRPGELDVDGVLMTPDGMEFEQDATILLHEIKGTFLSSKNPATENSKWMWQVAGYMHGITETYGLPCTKVIIHPFHIRGDYKGIDPAYCPQLIEFDPVEIADNWKTVLKYRDQAEKE